jgi:hypothetical protein
MNNNHLNLHYKDACHWLESRIVSVLSCHWLLRPLTLGHNEENKRSIPVLKYVNFYNQFCFLYKYNNYSFFLVIQLIKNNFELKQVYQGLT